MKLKTLGRPSKMTDDVLRKLRIAFLSGYNDQEACIYAQIGESTLYDYQHLYPEFVDYKRGWKLNPILKAKFTIYNSLHDVRVAMWYLERKCGNEFARR